MLAIRMRNVCFRSQRLLLRQSKSFPSPIVTTSCRLLSASANSEPPKKMQPKDEIAKLFPPKKKIDYKKKAREFAAASWQFTKTASYVVFDHIRHPTKIPTSAKYCWKVVKDEAHHYWVWLIYRVR